MSRLGGPRSLALVWLVWLVALPCACAITFISSYDETTDQGVTALSKNVGQLLGQLDQTPVPDYASMQPGYASVEADLAALRLRNEARPKNSTTVKQLDQVKAILDKLEEVHKSGKFVQVMVGPTRDSFDQAFRAILKLELAKKELDQKD
jgi:hypothetical protein